MVIVDMRKNFMKLFCIAVIVFLTGCLSKEQKEEVKKIEDEATSVAEEYLRQNYNVMSLTNLLVRYNGEGNTFGPSYSDITDYATAEFKYWDTESKIDDYVIICNYKTKKCYDNLAYKRKVNPILVEKVSSDLKDYNINLQPSHININVVGFSRFVSAHRYYDGFDRDYKYYSVFNNEDVVSSYVDIINYYSNLGEVDGLDLIYITDDKFIANKIDAYKYLNNKYNFPISVSVYSHDDILHESLYINGNDRFNYISNDILRIGNYIASWELDDKDENGDYFEINLVKNSSFSNTIELYDKKYELFNSDVLSVKNINKKGYIGEIYLETNDKVCENSIIVYIEDGEYYKAYGGTDGTYIDGGEQKLFAIYCEQ